MFHFLFTWPSVPTSSYKFLGFFVKCKAIQVKLHNNNSSSSPRSVSNFYFYTVSSVSFSGGILPLLWGCHNCLTSIINQYIHPSYCVALNNVTDPPPSSLLSITLCCLSFVYSPFPSPHVISTPFICPLYAPRSLPSSSSSSLLSPYSFAVFNIVFY